MATPRPQLSEAEVVSLVASRPYNRRQSVRDAHSGVWSATYEGEGRWVVSLTPQGTAALQQALGGRASHWEWDVFERTLTIEPRNDAARDFEQTRRLVLSAQRAQ